MNRVTTAEIQEALGITKQAVGQWNLESEKQGRSKTYSVVDVIRKVKEIHAADSGKIITTDDGRHIDIEREKAMKLQAERVAQEHKNNLDMGDVIPIDYAYDKVGKVATQIASIIQSIPASIKRKYPSVEKKVLKVVEAECEKACNLAGKIDVGD